MRDYAGWIVRSVAGRDKGDIFCVVGTDQENRLLLADGKRRKLAKPKGKKLGHVECLTDHLNGYDHPAIEKLKAAGLDRYLEEYRTQFKAYLDANPDVLEMAKGTAK